ncbi:MAG: hypothetical protein GXX79_05805 [Actinomycetales bacterium]|nr:hypothetical protein [Actinomycetales bacterium]
MGEQPWAASPGDQAAEGGPLGIRPTPSGQPAPGTPQPAGGHQAPGSPQGAGGTQPPGTPSPGTPSPWGDQPQWGGQPQGGTQPQWGGQPQGGTQPQWGGQPQGGTPPQWGTQPQWGGQPQGGTQPQWGDQPQWGGVAREQGGQGGPWGPGWGTARPKPGIIPLRPIVLGEILDGAFQAIRTNPRTMIGFSAIVAAVTTVITVVPQAFAMTGLGDSSLLDPNTTTVDPDEVIGLFSGVLAATLIPALIQSLALIVLTGMLMIAVSSAVLGRRTPPGELWSRTRRRVPGLVGLSLLENLVLILVPIALIAPGVVLLVVDQAVAGVIIGLVGGIGFVVADVFLYTRWSMAPPALLLEEQGVIASLRRSWRITSGSFWRVFLILLLTSVIVFVASSALTVPFSLLGSLVVIGQDNPYASFSLNLAQYAIGGVGQIVAYSVLLPFQAAVTALLYVDLRMRREGLDLELMRAHEGGLPT